MRAFFYLQFDGVISMSELEQLKKRIDDSGPEGVKTAHIREDYEPAGDLMIHNLTESREYTSRRDPDWKIFKAGMEPY
jgi:hypothetical protein